MTGWLSCRRNFDHLENVGVFKHPGDLGIVAEYVNPSSLVKKPSGGNRLVTAFAEVGQYAKPQPSLMPDVDSTLSQIARWKLVITTDLMREFYQILSPKVSMKYHCVVTRFVVCVCILGVLWACHVQRQHLTN